MRRRFGERLLEDKIIDELQLAEALRYQQRYGGRLGRILLMQNALSEAQLVEALSRALSVPSVDLSTVAPDPVAVARVSGGFAMKHDIFPVRFEAAPAGGDRLTIATCDPHNFRLLDELSFMVGAEVAPVLAEPSAIDQAVLEHYGAAQHTTPRVLEGAILAAAEPGDSEMTLLRSDGAEEQVRTGAHPGGAAAEAATVVPVPIVATPIARAPSRHPLFDEDPVLLTEPKRTPSAVSTLPPSSASAPALPPGDFDAALGDLLQQAELSATTEAVERLQHMFWALVRGLAKRGLITSEEIQAELAELEPPDR